jgi:hypothetical protein
MAAPDTFTDWFGAVLDEELAKVPVEKRAAWLQRQRNVYIRRHRRFHETDGDSEAIAPHPKFGVPTAFDMLAFITIIDQRMVQHCGMVLA